MYMGQKKSPKIRKGAQLNTPSRSPWVAALSAASISFSPSRREIRELTPTPVPTATAISSVWMGNASDTAASAFTPSRETKMLSTML